MAAAVHVLDHPLIQHKLTLMRRRKTSTTNFRRLLNEIGALMAYEVTRDAPMNEVKIDTPLVKTEIRIAEIGINDSTFANGGIKRQIRIFRLPDENTQRTVRLDRKVTLVDDSDNALYVCIAQEDGHLVWSSPIYVCR